MPPKLPPPMNTFPLRFALALAFVVGVSGCDLFEVDDRPDPNGPSRDEILANPTDAILTNLAIGVESSSRVALGQYLFNVGVIGREYWRTSSADPRFTSDLLGKGGAVLDNNTFYITQPWAARYRSIRNANTLVEGLALNPTLSGEAKAGGRGFAQTWAAYQYLLNLNLTAENGIRFIEVGADEAGPVVTGDAALAEIAALLDEGAGELAAGGDAFFFPVAAGFGTPAGFRQVNRGLAARVALYRGQYQAALTLLGESFLDADGDLATGAYHVFSTAAGDLTNPAFVSPTSNVSSALLAHPSFIADAEEGDARLQKVFDRGESLTFDGLTSQFTVNVFPTNTSPLPVIRNAELILIRAEARARTGDLVGAVADLDVIRSAAGLEDYDGDETEAAVIDEVLRQRRYELYGEGHRWVDGRRLGLLGDTDEFPIDREGDDVFAAFPIPLSENVGG